MSGPRARDALAVLAACLGVVCILFAHDVRAWRDLFQSDAAAYSNAPLAAVSGNPGTWLPQGPSMALLGVVDDRLWPDALRRFAVAYRDTLGVNALGRSDFALLKAGVSALRPVTQDPDPVRASQAYNLLAVLVFREATPGAGTTDPTLLSVAITDFQNAVRLDPTDEQAKKNLELGLRVLVAVSRIQQGQAPGKKATTKRGGGFGGPPGEGY